MKNLTPEVAWLGSMHAAIADLAKEARFLPHSDPANDLAAFAGKVLEISRDAVKYANGNKTPTGLEADKWQMLAKLAALPSPALPTYAFRSDFEYADNYCKAVLKIIGEHIYEVAKDARDAARCELSLSAFERLGELAYNDEGCSGEFESAAEAADEPYENVTRLRGLAVE